MRAIALAFPCGRGSRSASTKNAVFATSEAVVTGFAAPAHGCLEVKRRGYALPSAAVTRCTGRRTREPTGGLCRRFGPEVPA
jgi:hypothetical protein